MLTGTMLAGVANAESFNAFSALSGADIYVRLRRSFRASYTPEVFWRRSGLMNSQQVVQ